jgi:hypothetical protein
VSGYFLAGRFGECGWYGRAVSRRIKTLVIPFALWAVVGVAVKFCVWHGARMYGCACGVENPFAIGFFRGLSRSLGFDLQHIDIGIIWYLRMLFALVLISPVIYLAIERLGWISLAAPFLVYGLYETFSSFSQFWEYMISIRGIAYFILGVMIRMGKLDCVIGRVRQYRIFVYMAGLVLLVAHCSVNGYMFIFAYGLTDFLMVMPLIVLIWHLTSRIHLPRWCTENSFAIDVIHANILILSVVFFVLSGLREHMSRSIGLALARLALACACSLLVATFLKRTMPNVAKVLFGGR